MIDIAFTLFAIQASNSLASLLENVETLDPAFTYQYMSAGTSWALHVGSYGRTYSEEEQHNCRMKFQCLQFKGPVKLQNPDVLLMVLFDYSDNMHDAVVPEYPEVPCFLGRVLARGGMREVRNAKEIVIISHITLKT